jgi:CDP-glucose 4,6-dehydratase
LVNKIIKLMGSKLSPKILNQAPNEIKHQYLSAKKAKEILNWIPKYTLDDGLKKTIEWYKDFLNKNSK